MALALNTYAEMAKKIFDDLTDANSPKSIYANGNYWRVGCVYDTLLDFMQYAVTQKMIDLKTARGINTAVLDFYPSMSGCWYDDYCWWVIALLKSYTYSTLFEPGDINRCKTYIGDAWAIVNKGRPGVPYSGGAASAFDVCDQKVYGVVKPLYPGGTWQYDIYTTRLNPCDTLHNNPIPIMIDGKLADPPELGPYQLSVINGLNMVMTQRLSNAKIIPDTDANLQYGFIRDWTSTSVAADVNLLNPFDSKGGAYGLIRERVGRYLDPKVAVTSYNPKYESWAGDQGLFMGGLFDYFLIKKDRNCMDLIRKILIGVKMKMTMKFIGRGITYNAIYSWSGGKDPIYGPEGPLSNDPADYCSGLGVFMRYLYYCCQDNNLRLAIINDPGYLDLMRQTANACYYDAYPAVNQEQPMFRQFNRLAGLLAAVRILPA